MSQTVVQSKTGVGSYASEAPAGAAKPPAAIYATDSLNKKMPTNDWWSSLAWLPFSERHYPHPLAVQAEKKGLRIFYPGNRITSTKDAIYGFMPPGGLDDFLLGHSGQPEFPAARVQDFSDWFVSAKFSSVQNEMTVSYGHGSPFVFAQYLNGQAQLTFAKEHLVWSGDENSACLGITVGEKHYGLFGPAGCHWTGWGTTTLNCKSERDYFSIAVLPDNQQETLNLFRRFAYNHVTDTKIDFSYDPQSSSVTTTFWVETELKEGKPEEKETNSSSSESSPGTLLALYPHQWKHTKAPLLDVQYPSVRGSMKLISGGEFQTVQNFHGVLPVLPNAGGCDLAKMKQLLKSELKHPLGPIKDTYWEGKALGKAATNATLAECYGETEIAAQLHDRIRERLEFWLSARNEKQEAKDKGMFWYDSNWGTLIGTPASYGSDNDLNDHHFHYGYFIRAAAEVARRDPQWAQQWGGMIELLIRDIASPERNDPLFPLLRNFDPYAGHSWASGHAKFGDGNNNESSSEAMNAWYGIILWGEFTGNRELRDLGVYLYTTEMNAIHEYWFDVHGTNHPETYTPSVVTMVWGGKGANGTWFSANPEVVHGINWLPLHGGSLYLGHFQAYAKKNYQALLAENESQPWDEWADLVWMYRALSDPDNAMQQFNDGHESSSTEGGNSLPNAYHWIGSLQKLGSIQPSVTADMPLYAVFDQGKKRTYSIYRNSTDDPPVTFSDGFRMSNREPGTVIATRQLE